MAAILAVTLILVMAGCGGSGSGSPSGKKTTGGILAKGTVTLPVGFKLPFSQLQVLSEAGQANVGSSGAFTVPVASTGPRIIQLVDKVTAKIALLGYVDAASSGSVFSGGHGDISAKGTADALLFMGLLGGMLPTDSWSTFIQDIRGTSQELQVSDAVTTAVVADPTAISDGDADISNAIGAVQSTFTGPNIVRPDLAYATANSKLQLSKHSVSVQRVYVSPPTASGALIKVEPGSPQSSLIIEPNPSGDGIVAVSTSRRRGSIFVYKVGTGPSATQITPINPPQETFADIDIEPTLEISGVGTGILNGLQGKFAYLPFINPPILLAPDPVQKVAVYDVVAIGPGSTDTIPAIEKAVAPDSTASQAEYDKEWRAALLASRLKVLFDDILEPLLIEMVAGKVEENLLPEDTALEGALTTASHSAPGFDAALEAGDLKGAATAIMNAIEHNSNGVRAQFISALSQKLVSSGKLDAASFQLALQNASKAIAIIGAIDKGIALVDITQAFHDNRIYNDADLWTADVLKPIVTIIPQTASVDTNDPLVHLSVAIRDVTDLSTFRFKWSNTALEGNLESSTSTSPLSTGIIPDSTCVYVTDFTKFSVGTKDTVSVQVFSEDDLDNPIGTATAVITGAPSPCTNAIPPQIHFGNAPAGVQISETATRPGDKVTVTINAPADPTRQLLQVLWLDTTQQFQQPFENLISVDGVQAKTTTPNITFVTTRGTLSSQQYNVSNIQAAQTHTLVFQMLNPTDSSGNLAAVCTEGDVKGSPTPPYVEAFSQDPGVSESFTIQFLNENP